MESLVSSPDGRWVIFGGHDRSCLGALLPHKLWVWDAKSGTEFRCLQGHRGEIKTLAVTSDGRRIVWGLKTELCECGTSSPDSSTPIRNLLNAFLGPCGPGVQRFHFTFPQYGEQEAGRKFLSGFYWGEQCHCLRGHEDIVTSVAVSADGRCIVSGSDDKTVARVERQNRKETALSTGTQRQRVQPWPSRPMAGMSPAFRMGEEYGFGMPVQTRNWRSSQATKPERKNSRFPPTVVGLQRGESCHRSWQCDGPVEIFRPLETLCCVLGDIVGRLSGGHQGDRRSLVDCGRRNDVSVSLSRIGK